MTARHAVLTFVVFVLLLAAAAQNWHIKRKMDWTLFKKSIKSKQTSRNVQSGPDSKPMNAPPEVPSSIISRYEDDNVFLFISFSMLNYAGG
jgi:hypothetical protein